MIIISSIIPLKLSGKVRKGVEGVGGIEALIIFSMAAFHFTVVSWRKGTDLFVANSVLGQFPLEERQIGALFGSK